MFGRFVFPAPIRILVVFQVLVTILGRLTPGYIDWLTLDLNKVLAGQVWRIFTFIFVSQGSIWFIIFYLFIMWLINDGLEQAWGEFRVNLYLFGTWLGLVIAAFFVPSYLRGYESIVLYSSLFIAFACLYPDFEFLLFFILPVKVKWLALVNVAYLFTLALGSWPATFAITLGMGSFLLVFVPRLFYFLAHRTHSAARRSRFDAAQSKASPGQAFHVCSHCGTTDAEQPDLDFRIGDDDEEYCINCLPKGK